MPGLQHSYLVSRILMEGSYCLPKKQVIPMKTLPRLPEAGAVSRECFYPSAESGSTLRQNSFPRSLELAALREASAKKWQKHPEKKQNLSTKSIAAHALREDLYLKKFQKWQYTLRQGFLFQNARTGSSTERTRGSNTY
jgi:hypothetical protein